MLIYKIKREKPPYETNCCGYSLFCVSKVGFVWGSYKILSGPEPINGYYEIECAHKNRSFCREDMIDTMKKLGLISGIEIKSDFLLCGEID